MKKRAEHYDAKRACGRVWTAPAPGYYAKPVTLRHLCRAHVVETGECVCPCGARHQNAKATEGEA